MESIKIQFSSSYCSIVSDIDATISEDLYNTLAFQPSGYFFSPKYQNFIQARTANLAAIEKGLNPPYDLSSFNLWDGYIRFYRMKDKKFRVGLLTRVVEMLVIKYGLEVEIIDAPESGEWVQHTNSYTLRPYQRRIVQDMVTKRFGIVKSPPRSGKTIMSVAVIDSEQSFPVVFFCRSLDLAHQTVEVFKKYLPHNVGLVGDGEADVQEITVMTIQSVYNAYSKKYGEKVTALEKDVPNKLAIKRCVSNAKLVFYDECFPTGTLICIDEGKYLPIEYVYENDNITHILSYNEQTKQLERKRILKRFKKETEKENMFEVRSGDLHTRPTSNHPFWTENRGYVSAEKLTCDDKLKTLVDITNFLKDRNSDSAHIKKRDIPATCTICNKTLKSFALLNKHIKVMHTEEGVLLRKQQVAKMDYKKIFEKRENNGKWRKSLKKMGLRRLGENNPIHRHRGTIEKISRTAKHNFKMLSIEKQKEQIIRFMNAPKFRATKMNKPETIVDNFKFENLLYTGNGYHVSRKLAGIKLSLPKGDKYKFPDFTYLKEHKVIEIADFEYWHSVEEMREIKESYNNAGWECLVLDAKQVKNERESTKLQIYKFLFNHNVQPDLLRYNAKGYSKSTVTVYNFEVEDNNNYFADGFLVHNCHHSKSSTSKFILNKCTSATLKIGLTATPFYDKDPEILIEEVMGPIIAEASYSELIKEGFLLQPYIYMYKLPKPEHAATTYPTAYKQEIVESDFLNGLIKKIVDSLVAGDNTVVVQTEYVNHTKKLAKLLGYPYLTGKEKSEEREEKTQQLKDRKIKCLVSTLFEEGLDIPSLEYTINVAGGLSNVSTLQRMRSITISEGKTTCGIIDFFHKGAYLHKHSLARKKLYKSEPEFIYIERDVSNKSLEEIS